MVTTDAASARKAKTSTRKRLVVASRRSTKLRSWTRTTKPRGASAAKGIAVVWSCPPGTENPEDQVAQVVADSGAGADLGPEALARKRRG